MIFAHKTNFVRVVRGEDKVYRLCRSPTKRGLSYPGNKFSILFSNAMFNTRRLLYERCALSNRKIEGSLKRQLLTECPSIAFNVKVCMNILRAKYTVEFAKYVFSFFFFSKGICE